MIGIAACTHASTIPRLATFAWIMRNSWAFSEQVLQAIWLNKSFMMVRVMSAASHHNKIFRSIVRANTIYMMDNLCLLNGSPYCVRRHKMMLRNIPIISCIGMRWIKNKSVSTIRGVLATIPIRMKRTSSRSIFIVHTCLSVSYQPIAVNTV